MTCIVGLTELGTVYIGGDSAGVNSRFDLAIRADQKVFINGPFVMGFTSSFRMGQLLRYKLTPPERYESQDLYNFMVTAFIDAVRACLKTGGLMRKENEVEQGGFFLVGYKGRLFEIESDFQVGERQINFAAVGCGADLAMGSLYSTRANDPITRIKLALEAASFFSAAVKPPFFI